MKINNSFFGIRGVMSPKSYRKNILKLTVPTVVAFLLGAYTGAFAVIGANAKRQGLDATSGEVLDVAIRVNPFDAFAREFTPRALVIFFSIPVLMLFYGMTMRRFRDINPLDKWVWARAAVPIAPILFYYACSLLYNFTSRGSDELWILLLKVMLVELVALAVCSFWKGKTMHEFEHEIPFEKAV
jgi:flagellar basal body-associated protein FliL